MIREDEIAGKLPFYEKLNKKQKELILNNCYKQTFNKGEQYVCEKEEDAVFVKKGALNVFMVGDNGEETYLYRVNKDEVFITNGKLLYEFIGNGETLTLPAEYVQILSNGNVNAENFLLRARVKHAESGIAQINSVFFASVDKRIANYLINQTMRSHNHIVNATHEQIAKFIGSSREVVTRRLKVMEEAGAVTLSRGKVSIVSREYIKRLK